MEYIIYIIICILQPICWPLPEMSTILYGTYKFGAIYSFIIGYIFILMGIVIMYKVSFCFSKKHLSRIKKSKKFLKFKKFISKNEILTTGILFVLPILPDEIICVGASILEIKFKVFITIAMFFKFISIGVIAFSEPLAGIFNISKLTLIIVELIFLFLISTLYSRYKNNKSYK